MEETIIVSTDKGNIIKASSNDGGAYLSKERQILLLRSDENGTPPNEDGMSKGELAVNYAADNEIIYVKNSNDKLGKFLSENLVKELIDEKISENGDLSDYSITEDIKEYISTYVSENGGSKVSFEQIQTSGTQIGTITIDGTITSIYAPVGGDSSSGSGGSTVTYTSIITSGTQIGTIAIDGTSTSIYTPTPTYTQSYPSTSGVQIGTFSFNGTNTVIYAPVGGDSSSGSSVADGNYYHTPIYTSGFSIGTGVGISNLYVPVATSSQYGVVKLGSSTTQSVSANSVTSTASRTYAVQLNSSGQMVVNVPWETSSGGSSVSFTQIQTSGTQIGTITIDGTSTSIYAPSASSSSDVNVTNTVSTSSSNVYITGTSSSSTNTGTQLFSTGVYFVPSSGYVYASAYYETSDANLKENISSVSDEDKSREISIREFSFKSDESKTKRYGVIAQELEEVGLGNLVSTNDDGVKSVDYVSMLCLKIAQLENRINELENK